MGVLACLGWPKVIAIASSYGAALYTESTARAGKFTPLCCLAPAYERGGQSAVGLALAHSQQGMSVVRYLAALPPPRSCVTRKDSWICEEGILHRGLAYRHSTTDQKTAAKRTTTWWPSGLFLAENSLYRLAVTNTFPLDHSNPRPAPDTR